MRIAVLGPTHPYRGGVAAHTTRTAQALAEAGQDVDLVSWSRLLPEALHPGEEALPGGEPEAEYARTSRPLHWNHSAAMAEDARALGARTVAVADLPPHLPGVHVTVAGEHWGAAGERVAALAAEPALTSRVHRIAGYVPTDRVRGLLAEHDVLAPPYRHGTASQNVLPAHAHGLPVLATRVGTFPAQVRDGVDGVLVDRDDVGGLAAGLSRLADPEELATLEAGVPAVDLEGPWLRYVQALTTGSPGAGAAEPAALDGVGSPG